MIKIIIIEIRLYFFIMQCELVNYPTLLSKKKYFFTHPPPPPRIKFFFKMHVPCIGAGGVVHTILHACTYVIIYGGLVD